VAAISACRAAALVMPWFRWLADVRLERVELVFPAGGLDQQPGGIGLGGEPVRGVPGQAQDLGGFPLGAPGLQQLVHGGVPLAGTGHQGPLAAVHVPQPVRPGRERGSPDVLGCLLPGRGIPCWPVRGPRRLRR
jgi:hypothetical protein